MYSEGLPISKIRDIVKTDYYTVQKIIIDSGLHAKYSGLRNRLPHDEIVTAYNSGESVLSISKRFKVSRNAINAILRHNNVTLRPQKDANKFRYANSTEDEKKAITKKANEAMRKQPQSFHHESAIKQAITKQNTLSKVGMFEQEIINYFHKAYPIPQLAFDAYNIDIAIWPVAIEVHVNSGHPHNMPYYRKRIINLLKGGWFVLYVKITKSGLQQTCFDEIAAFIDTASLNPTSISQYRVIRGTGELIATGKRNGDNLTIIEGS